MWKLKAYRNTGPGLTDLLRYANLAGGGLVTTKDGSVIAGYYFRPPDTASATDEMQALISSRANDAMLPLGTGWTIWTDVFSVESADYPAPEASFFPDPISLAVDEERRRRFMAEGEHFDNERALFLCYTPPLRQVSRLGDLAFSDGDGDRTGIFPKIVAGFERTLERFEDTLGDLIGMRRMRSYKVVDMFGREHLQDELVNTLNHIITGKPDPLMIPAAACYLDSVLGAKDFHPGERPYLGGEYLRTVSVDGFPAEHLPNVMARLNTLAMPYRFSQRAILLDPQDAVKEINTYKRKWGQKTRGILSVLAGGKDGATNEHAVIMRDEAEAAASLAQSGSVLYLYYSAVVVLRHADPDRLEDMARHAVRAVKDCGFDARVEDTNTVEAWLGSLPGDGVRNVRRPLIHTQNLADFLPLSGVWTGLDHNPCPLYPPNSPPLLHAATVGCIPYRLNVHVGDVPHTIILGPIGKGKCLGRGTAVMMFDGTIKPVEEIRCGDLLMGPDSSPRRVVSLTRGTDELFRVTPVKGDAYVVNSEHILSLKMTGGSKHSCGVEDGSIVNIGIRDYFSRSRSFHLSAKGWRTGVDFPNHAEPPLLDPYFLGVWLGDGNSRDGRITNPDQEIIDCLRGYSKHLGLSFTQRELGGERNAFPLSMSHGEGGRWHKAGNPIRKGLLAYQLLQNKHIPHRYRTGSRQERREILAGILDADGHWGGGRYELTLKCERLMDDVIFVARSLGLSAYKLPVRKVRTNNGVAGDYWKCLINGPVDTIPCKVERKKATPRRQIKNPLLTGITVESIGEGEYFGFEVEGPDRLFLLGDFTVTHNSTLTSLIALQALRYADMRIWCLDNKRGMYATVKACGGNHYEVGGTDTPAFCPLGVLEEEGDFIWAQDWLETCYQLQTGKPFTPNQRGLVYSALKNLAHKSQRSMTDFHLMVQDEEVRDALLFYTLRGAGGYLLDARADGIALSHFNVFETQELMNLDDRMRLPVLLYLFQRFERSLDGRPALLFISEAWVALGNPVWRARLRKWLKLLRSKNCGVIMDTQSLSDAFRSDILDALIESCPTKIYLPNEEALKTGTAGNPGPLELYRSMQLNPNQIEIIRNARGKREYYVTSPEGCRLIDLDLGPMALAIAGATSEDDARQVRRLVQRHGGDWVRHWLAHKGVDHAPLL